MHEGWYQDHADDGGVEQDRHGQSETEHLHHDDPRKGKRPKDKDHDQRGGSNHRRGGAQALHGRFAVATGPVERLFDPAQQEDFVVHTEPEHHGKDEHRNQHEDRFGWSGQMKEAGAVPLLEDQHDQPEGGRHRERVHQDRLERHQDRSERQRQHHGSCGQHQHDQPREDVEHLFLQVDAAGDVTADPDLRMRS
ncbi:MAG: hypothetical protein KF785_00165 [Gemmatimonadales bacterium]|nr:hypothetical protein [Gemmatimonadales bacterium]